MVHRIALLIGGIGAAGVLALAVVLGGIPAVLGGAASSPNIETGVEQLVDDSAAVSSGQVPGDVVTVVDTVYIDPDGARNSGNGRSSNSADPTASPDPTFAPDAAAAAAAPQPTASPFDDWDDDDDHRSGHRDRDDDDRHGDDDHDDEDRDGDDDDHGDDD